MRIVSNYRNEVNRKLSERLAASCARFELPCEIEQVTDLGDCLLQLQWKPAYWLWQLSQGGSFIWIDPWAEIVKPPILLVNTSCDLGAFLAGSFYWSGTVIVNDTPKTRETLQAWIALNAQYPELGDENFTRAILDVQPNMKDLPNTYCWLSKTFKDVWPTATPVIEHHPEETLVCLPQAI